MGDFREKITPPLPVDACIPDIRKTFNQSRSAVLTAPPGAGKTTRVPLELIDEDWLIGKKIVMLEPRRLAAKACAVYMADLLNESVGQQIGYRIRHDSRTGPLTRIEVVTQGIFIRMIQADPLLQDVGLVIFDEFHERNLQNDLSFALCLDTFNALNDELHLLVMSATMELKSVSTLMGNAPVIQSQGKSFPVKTIYKRWTDHRNQPLPIEQACAKTIDEALLNTDKDILTFLPGTAEIRRLSQILKRYNRADTDIFPLYGNLSGKEQFKVFKPAKNGRRKVILATSIAETSVTINGIGAVIDSGVMRTPKFSAGTGMTQLKTQTVSKASADQRRGRAGRTAPGICYRLWSEYEHQFLIPYTLPEILNVDLSGLVLELAAWGVTKPEQMKWLDMPEPVMISQAVHMLTCLGALETDGRISLKGKKMVDLGIHPRLAHILIKGKEMGQLRLACLIAALVSERDILIFDTHCFDPDIGLRLEVLEQIKGKRSYMNYGFQVRKGLAKRIIQSAYQYESRLSDSSDDIGKSDIDIDRAGELLAFGFPDRIARKRKSDNRKYLMASGKGAYFQQSSSLSTREYIVAVQLDGHPKNARIFLAAEYSKSLLENNFEHRISCTRDVLWNNDKASIEGRIRKRFDQLILSEHPLAEINKDVACEILINQIKSAGLNVLDWPKKLLNFKYRVIFLRQMDQFKQLPDLTDDALTGNLDHWLKPFLSEIFSFKQLKELNLESAVLSLFSWDEQQIVNTHAPSHIFVPSGSKRPLKYHKGNKALENPILEVRLQEMFSLVQTPRIAGNSVPITLCLLSPANRPVQITDDLESFWKNTYPDVKKDLMGRYPKHHWPENPLTAEPTSRAKKRKK